MKFGKIFNERRNQGWRCISYDKLKQLIKVSDDTIDGAALFYEAMSEEIAQVDEFFKSVLSQAQNDIADVADVRQHAVLNYLAVLKILKKHDKKLQKHVVGGIDALPSPKEQLFKASFCTALTSSALLHKKKEVNYEEELAAGSGSRPRAMTDCLCPVCYEEMVDPAVLPCHHRFCLSCLANCATTGLNSCPLCRREQSLEPVNLEIETILGCFAQRYYPANQAENSRPPTPCSDEDSKTSTKSTEPSECCEKSDEQKSMSSHMLLSTPRASQRVIEPCTPPQMPHPKRGTRSPLLQALHKDSVLDVQRVLEDDSEAANMPFFDDGFEPPLCISVRLGCNVQIVALLLEYRAQVDSEDKLGRTPLAILSSTPCGQESRDNNFGFNTACQLKQEQGLLVAQALLYARADPLAVVNGKSCVDLARASGNAHLVRLFVDDKQTAVSLGKRSQIPDRVGAHHEYMAQDVWQPPPWQTVFDAFVSLPPPPVPHLRKFDAQEVL